MTKKEKELINTETGTIWARGWCLRQDKARGPLARPCREYEREETIVGNKTVEMVPIVYTIPEVAKLLCIGRATAYNLAHQEDFPSFRRGRSVRVRKDDLDEWIERKKEAGEGW